MIERLFDIHWCPELAVWRLRDRAKGWEKIVTADQVAGQNKAVRRAFDMARRDCQDVTLQARQREEGKA
jgi:hypothetical protein